MNFYFNRICLHIHIYTKAHKIRLMKKNSRSYIYIWCAGGVIYSEWQFDDPSSNSVRVHYINFRTHTLVKRGINTFLLHLSRSGQNGKADRVFHPWLTFSFWKAQHQENRYLEIQVLPKSVVGLAQTFTAIIELCVGGIVVQSRKLEF